MKSKLTRALAAMLCLALVLSLAACKQSGGEESDGTQSTASSEPQFNDLDEFLNDETVKTQIESTKTANNEDEDAQMTCDITSDGNTLVYTYTFKPDVDTTGMAELLEKEMTNYTTTFTNIANALSDSIKGDGAQVKLIYLDSTGKEIFSKTFTPEE